MKTFLTFHENAYGYSFGVMKPVADLHAKFSQRDVDDIEKFADRILKKYGIDIEFTRHFVDRLNDPRNTPDIKVAELQRFFKKIQRVKGTKIKNPQNFINKDTEVQAVLKDMDSNLNLPVVIKYEDEKYTVINKTIMRKKNFSTSNPIIAYEKSNPRIPRKKGQPAGSKKHSDLYTDENPVGTIHGLKFATVKDAKASVKKIENSGKTHAHKIQAAIAMEQRAKEMGKTAEAAVYRTYIEKMKKITKQRQKMKESVYDSKCPPGYRFDKKLRSCVPKRGIVYAYPFFGGSNKSNQNGQQTGNGNGQTGNGNGGNGNGGGNGGGNSGGESFISFIAADVRKMPDGRYGVYADKFKNKKRVMTPGGKHAKELKKVYKNKKDANDYMAAIMIAKGGG